MPSKAINQNNYPGVGSLLGFLLWLVRTLMIRFWGEWLFTESSLWMSIPAFVLIAWLHWRILRSFFHYFELNRLQSIHALAFILLPILPLDVLSLALSLWLLPNLSLHVIPLYASWLVWGHFTLLCAALFVPLPTTHTNEEKE